MFTITECAEPHTINDPFSKGSGSERGAHAPCMLVEATRLKVRVFGVFEKLGNGRGSIGLSKGR